MQQGSDETIPVYTLEINSMTKFSFYIGKNAFAHETKLHQHQFVQINYITKGSGIHLMADKQQEIQAGSIFVVPPFVPHKIYSSSETSCIELIEIEFVPEFLNEQFSDIINSKSLFDFKYISLFLVNDDTKRPALILSANDQTAVGRITQSLLLEYRERSPLFEHAFKALLLELLVILSRSYEQSPQSDEPMHVFFKHRAAIQTVLDYIDHHFCEDIKLEDIARVATMSNTYFCYFFKLLAGKTFTQYLIEKRLECAKEHLIHSDLSVTDIAMRTGFNSVSHFIRTFKAAASISPIQYRKLARQQHSPEEGQEPVL